VKAPYVTGATCELLVDEQYSQALRHSIQSAQRRCLCTIFIIDLKSRCPANCVADVIDDLEAAHWRGVDVRVLIGGSRSSFEIGEAAAIAFEHLAARCIPSRWLTSDKSARGNHAKAVIADETVLLGSHNWSPGSFHKDTQDSVCITSAPLAEYFAGLFESSWFDDGSSRNG